MELEVIKKKLSSFRVNLPGKTDTRRLVGNIKGLKTPVALVCSEKPKKKGRKYLACSNTTVSTGAIVRAYRKRWLVEMFHRTVKSQLGFEHAGVSDFDALVAHVHWVYCSYLLLQRIEAPPKATLHERQKLLQAKHIRQPLVDKVKEISLLTNRFGGLQSIRRACRAAIEEEEAA